jgi:hypothetical protein
MGAGATTLKGDALDREADVYLVPIGSLPEDLLPELVDYYGQVLGLNAVMTGSLPFEPTMRDSKREQLIAEKLLIAMGRGFRGWARNPRALFIGITGSDMYTTDKNWRFAFAVRRGTHLSVVSGARMVHPPDSTGAWPADRVARLRKMVTKTIAVQYLGLPLSSDPASVLYGRVLGLGDLDRIDEATIHRDVIEPSKTEMRLEAPLDPDDLLSLNHPFELQGERARGNRREGFLILGAIGLFVVLGIGFGVWTQRRTKVAWREVADQHGWRFVDADGPWYNRGSWRIELDVDGVSVVVELIQIGTYRSRIQLTRILGDISCPHDFRIVQESFYTRIQKQFGHLVEIEIGDSTYDLAYLVMCDAEEWLRHHLPSEVRARQLALKAMLFSENGRLEVRRFPIADNKEDLLSLIQVFADAAAAIRERPPVGIAPALSPVVSAPFPQDEAKSPVWAKHMLRILLAIGAIEFLGSFPLQRMILTEQTNAAWEISLPWAGGLTLAFIFCLLVNGGFTFSSMTIQRILAMLLMLPMIFIWYWGMSGPWVMGWNAMVGRPHAEGLYGPVIEKRVLKTDRRSLVLPHPSEDRMVRIRVNARLFETVRPGDPLRLNVSRGSLGFFYWLRE